MTWAFIFLWIYAGFILCLASRDDLRRLSEGEKFISIIAALIAWPLYPILFLMGD